MNSLFVGQVFGKCMNCGAEVETRQPWLSNMPIVNDGWYLVHCMNEKCHNYYGMEIREEEQGYIDFVNVEMKSERTEANILCFKKRRIDKMKDVINCSEK